MGLGYNAVLNTEQGFFIDTRKPIVGSVANGLSGVEQAIYSINDTKQNRLLGGAFIKVTNKQNGSELAPLVFNVTDKATRAEDVSGVLLWAGTDVAEGQGSLATTQYGLMTRFARLGSRVGVWLEVHSSNVTDLQNADIGIKLTLDAVNGGVKKADVAGGDTPIAGATLGSVVMEGQKVVWDNARGIFKTENASAVLVYLY